MFRTISEYVFAQPYNTAFEVIDSMEKLPIRKYPRLKEYDYSQFGSYFVTFCIKDKHQLLGFISVGSGFHARPTVALTTLGAEVEKTIQYICIDDEAVKIPHYIIMPNHVHLIVMLNSDTVAIGHGSPTLQSVIGRIKSYTTKRWNEINNIKQQIIWQRSFHEHIIRSEADYHRIWQYIDENPMRWTEDKYYIN